MVHRLLPSLIILILSGCYQANSPSTPVKDSTVNSDVVATADIPPAYQSQTTYQVQSSMGKSYFYREPDESSMRSAYLVNGESVFVQQVKNGFGYVDFTNVSGVKTMGWLKMAELTADKQVADLSLNQKYFGTQPEYNLKGRDGTEMVVNGNPIVVPAIDYTFTIKPDGGIDMIQVSSKDNQTVNYSGKYTLTSNSSDKMTLDCSVREISSSKYPSTPSFRLDINKSTHDGVYSGNNEPGFRVSAIKGDMPNTSTESVPVDNPAPERVASRGESGTVNGVYSYTDNSVEITVVVSGSRWTGKTKIISGFGSDYDAQNVQYDNGTVVGSDLYDNTGFVKIGNISGRYLHTTMGDNQVTLSK